MMKTRDCVEKWVAKMTSGASLGEKLRASSCYADGDYFVSYNTPIAKFRNGKFEVATRKYSVTTSKLQGCLCFSIPKNLRVDVYEIEDDGKFPYRR